MRQKNLVKKSDIASFLSYKVRCANFDLTTMFYIENGAHTQILTFYVKWIFKLTHATTVKMQWISTATVYNLQILHS